MFDNDIIITDSLFDDRDVDTQLDKSQLTIWQWKRRYMAAIVSFIREKKFPGSASYRESKSMWIPLMYFIQLQRTNTMTHPSSPLIYFQYH